jgi:hypothetical protein
MSVAKLPESIDGQRINPQGHFVKVEFKLPVENCCPMQKLRHEFTVSPDFGSLVLSQGPIYNRAIIIRSCAGV